MITKAAAKSGTKTRVTFKFVPEDDATTVSVLGEFNGWDKASNRLTKRKDGSFSGNVSIESGRSYRFRYLVDDTVWANDEAADSYIANRFGGQDSVLEL